MLQRFYEDNIQSRFIKALLYNTPIPTIQSIVPGDYIIKGAQYIYKRQVIKCTTSGIIGQEGKYEILGTKKVFDVGPIEFLNLIENAELVISSSFHGTVFSIIFEKQFFVETKKEKYENDRIINLLDNAGIKNREIKDQDWDHLSNSVEDWKTVKNNLSIKREESIQFLKDSLS